MAKKQPSPLDIFIKAIEKKHGAGVLFTLGGNVNACTVEAVPSQLLGLDEALGIMGWPRGRIVELYGMESGGKTTLALSAVKAFRAALPELNVLYVDVEHALDRTWMHKVGLHDDDFLLSQPDSGEQATAIAEAGAKSGLFSLIVIDSIAALAGQAELDGEMTDQQMGLVARILGKFFRKTAPALEETKTMLLCINQLRSKIGQPGTTRPGGRALKYYASVGIEVRRIGWIKEGEEIVGARIAADIKKSKIAPPYRSAILPLVFSSSKNLGYGFSSECSMIESGLKAGIFRKNGTWFYHGEESIGQGSLNAAAHLRENPETFQDVYSSYREAQIAAFQPVEWEPQDQVPPLDEESEAEDAT